MPNNARVVLQQRPKGPIDSQTFKRDDKQVPTESELQNGEVLVRVMYLSLDPAMRGWLNDARNYIPPVKIGEVMRAVGIGKVVASKCPKTPVGKEVTGSFGWQEYWKGASKHVEVLTPPAGATALDYLGPLGMSGMTAYFGLIDAGKIKDGETVVVSGAAGSVGLIVTQMALAYPKCKVIAIAGSPSKCKNLKDLGCHEVINYKDKDWKQQFRQKCKGVDVYFDNVGGEMLDLVLTRLNPHARVALCGAISGYNSTEPRPLHNYMTLISQKASIQGFIVMDYESQYQEGREALGKMMQDGKMKYKYHFVEGGIAACVDGLKGLFEGANEGKTVVKVWDGKPDRSSKL